MVWVWEMTYCSCSLPASNGLLQDHRAWIVVVKTIWFNRFRGSMKPNGRDVEKLK